MTWERKELILSTLACIVFVPVYLMGAVLLLSFLWGALTGF